MSPAEKLDELAKVTGRSVADLMTEGVDRLCRIYVGDPVHGPKESTWPFSKEHSDLSAEVVIRQVTPAEFELREPFKYLDQARRFDVPMSDISDLASVPMFLTWLIPRYGQHTLAALLHDDLQRHLITRQHPRHDDPERVSSAQADTIFRQALGHTRVPFLRRWVLWAAVSLRTVFKGGLVEAAAVILWVVLFALLGIAWPIAPIVAWASPQLSWRIPVLLLAAALLLPLLFCWLWFSWWRMALIAGLALMVIALPCLLAIVAGGVYFVLEALVRAALNENTALIVQPPKEKRKRD